MPSRTLVMVAVAVLVLAAAAALYWAQPREEKVGAAILGDPRVEAVIGGAPMGLGVGSVVGNGSRVPVEHTCDGADQPLPLRVEGVPKTARALLIILYDPDAPGGTFPHWLLLVKNPSSTVEIPKAPAVEGMNGFGRTGYGGPCPPPGDKPHRYYVVALSLDSDPGLPYGFTWGQALRAAERHVISWGYAVFYYSR